MYSRQQYKFLKGLVFISLMSCWTFLYKQPSPWNRCKFSLDLLTQTQEAVCRTESVKSLQHFIFGIEDNLSNLENLRWYKVFQEEPTSYWQIISCVSLIKSINLHKRVNSTNKHMEMIKSSNGACQMSLCMIQLLDISCDFFHLKNSHFMVKL